MVLVLNNEQWIAKPFDTADKEVLVNWLASSIWDM